MRTYIWTLVRKRRLYLPKPFSFFFLPSAFGCLEVRGRTGEPEEGIVDIDTVLMTCNASHENISSWVS